MKTRPEYREATEEGKPEKEMPQLGAANFRGPTEFIAI